MINDVLFKETKVKNKKNVLFVIYNYVPASLPLTFSETHKASPLTNICESSSKN